MRVRVKLNLRFNFTLTRIHDLLFIVWESYV